MTLLELVVCLVIGGASGAMVRALFGASTGWVVVSAVLGALGAFLGTSVAKLMRLQAFLAIDVAGHRLPILWSISGGVLLAMWGIAGQVLLSLRTQS